MNTMDTMTGNLRYKENTQVSYTSIAVPSIADISI